MLIKRTINRVLSKIYQTQLLKQYWSSRYNSLTYESTPWTPLIGDLTRKRVAMVTTGGVHLKSDAPFDMSDKDGDPSFRIFPSHSAPQDITITHDYYDHKDADKDINIVVPFRALHTCVEQGVIGSLSSDFYGFMGHIQGIHIRSLLKKSCPQLIRKLRDDHVDVVLLGPA